MSELDLAKNGILLLNKPLGWSSHKVVNAVRHATGIKRVGHTGTLDPFATGLLIVLVGRNFTKLQDSFLKQDKTYRCTLEFGYETTTLDSEGVVTHTADAALVQKITRQQVDTVFEKFHGTQMQQAPAFSAIKITGEKLYDHALKLLRTDAAAFQNWEKQLPSREISIHQLRILHFTAALASASASCTFELDCSSGTYVRSLVRDIGRALNVFATTTKLERIKIGKLEISQASEVNSPENWHWYLPQDLL